MQSRAGDIARKAVAYMRSQPAGHRATTGELAGAVERSAAGFGQYLTAVVRMGILKRDDTAGGTLWSLGPNSGADLPAKDADKRVVVRSHAAVSPSIFAYAAAMTAAPFSTALSTDGRLRIERSGVLVAELTNEERLQLIETAKNGVTPEGVFV